VLIAKLIEQSERQGMVGHDRKLLRRTRQYGSTAARGLSTNADEVVSETCLSVPKESMCEQGSAEPRSLGSAQIFILGLGRICILIEGDV
jgi:hypothetical protein